MGKQNLAFLPKKTKILKMFQFLKIFILVFFYFISIGQCRSHRKCNERQRGVGLGKVLYSRDLNSGRRYVGALPIRLLTKKT